MKDEAEEGFRRMAKTKASCWLSEEKWTQGEGVEQKRMPTKIRTEKCREN
jgi:hypothetical protein